MKLKAYIAAMAACPILLCSCGSNNSGQTALSPIGTTTLPTAASEETERKTTEQTLPLILYKEEVRTLDLGKAAEKAEIQSSDESVVSVKGKEITAVSCGDAVVTVTQQGSGSDFVTKLNVSVKYSRFDSSPEYTAGGMTGEKDGFVYHTSIKKGSMLPLGITGADSVTYSSSDESVAVVSDDGTVTAIAEGDAVITAEVVSGKDVCEQKTVLNVFKSVSTPLPQEEIDKFFSRAVFIGCSLGEGHKMYLESQGEGYLGSPIYLALSSYGIYNDDGRNGEDYMLSYNGVTDSAKNLLKDIDADSVFINLGTNDMYGDADFVGETFVEYLDGIREENPEKVIYVEAVTPVCIGSETDYLTNENVDALNKILEDYCGSNPDAYYIDINSILKNDDGGLDDKYTSDGYVHLNDAANEAWTKKLINTVKNQLVYQQRAEDAVQTFEECFTETARSDAAAAIDKLGDGAFKNALLSRMP